MAAAIGIAKTATEIFLGVGEVSIDNLTFKLHYKWSVTLFVVCSVLVQTSQFFGDPVQCETVSLTKNFLCSFVLAKRVEIGTNSNKLACMYVEGLVVKLA